VRPLLLQTLHLFHILAFHNYLYTRVPPSHSTFYTSTYGPFINVHRTTFPTAVTYIILPHNEILVNMFDCGMSTMEQLKLLSLALGIVVIHLFQVLASDMFSLLMTLLKVISPGIFMTFEFFIFGIFLSMVAFFAGQHASQRPVSSYNNQVSRQTGGLQ
jgi:hypothetical protein